MPTTQGDGSNQERYPCMSAGQCGETNSKNWVLQPNTTYYNTETEPIGTTNNDAIFPFPLRNVFSHTQSPINNVWINYTWTGALDNWTPSVASGANEAETPAANCQGWTSADSRYFGANGNNTSLQADSVGQSPDAYGLDCHLPLALYCVSQP